MADDRLPPPHDGPGHRDDGGDGPDGERVWDEYDWERFLQQQDQKTERYMELLEKYYDDPNRDALIAKEMGWHHLLDENGRDWGEDLDALFSREVGQFQGDEAEPDNATADPDTPERHHPLYQQASALAVSIEGLFASREGREPKPLPPTAAKLASNATLASVKLAAALSDDDIDELGMTIAYLKRALKAITVALDAAGQCEAERLLDAKTIEELRARIFGIRDGVVALMGEYRGEWRRRHGPHR